MAQRRIILACMAALALSACAATPYRAIGGRSTDGYSETKLADGRYQVRFVGNARTPQEQVDRYLLRRAAELTLANGHDWFRTVRPTVGNVLGESSRDGRSYRAVQGPGYQRWRDYGDFFAKSGFSLWRPIWRNFTGSKGERLEAHAEIVMGKGPVPAATAGSAVFDAREVLSKTGGR